MKKKLFLLTLLSCLSGSAFAQTNYFEHIQIGGKDFTNCTIRSLNAAQSVVYHGAGGSTVATKDLPLELQEQFGYDPTNAARYLSKKSQMDSMAHANERQQAAAAPLKQLADLQQMLKTLREQKANNVADLALRTSTYNSKRTAGLVTPADTKNLRLKQSEVTKQNAGIDKQIAVINYQEVLFRQQYNVPPPDNKVRRQ